MLPLTIGIMGKLNAIIVRSLGIFRNTADSRQTIKKILLKKKMMMMRSVFFFFFSCQSASYEKHNVWYLDCGCSNHML